MSADVPLSDVRSAIIGRVVTPFRRVLVAAIVVAALAGCTNSDHRALPTAHPDEFRDLPQIIATAKDLAKGAGDAHPGGVAIVNSSRAAVLDHAASASNSERNREMYFIRLDGHFSDCHWCSHLTDNPFPPTRWIGFDWDPEQHMVLDSSYGSAVHLEEFGKVYALDIE